MSTIRSSVVLSTLLLAGSAHAQQAAVADIPPYDCKKPGEYQPIDKSGPEQARFVKRRDAYKTCVDEYAKVARAKVAELSAEADAWNAAGNKAIDEFNAYVQQSNQAITGK